jgi:hypothetical protein
VREGRLISLSSTCGRWRNRWHLSIRRHGLSTAALKQRLKRAIIEGGSRKACNVKSTLARFLDSGGKAPACGVDQPVLLRSIIPEGLAGVVYTMCESWPEEAAGRSELARSYRTTVAANLACISFLEKLEALLSREHLSVMTLKGASLLDRCYSKVGLRPMEDLDLMVRPEDHARFAHILVASGFKQNRWRTDHFQGEFLTVDLHVHPLHAERIRNRSHLLPNGYESIWQKSVPWRNGFEWVRRPADADNICLLGLHVLKHYFARLIWFEDLRRMLQERSEAFWSILFQRAEALGCTKTLAYAIYLLDTLYPSFVRENKNVQHWSRSLSYFERSLLLLTISDKPLPLAAPILELLAVKGIRRRCSLAYETLFPKGRVRRAEFGTVRFQQRLLFIPRRLICALKLILQNLFRLFRIFARAFTHKSIS